MLTMYLHTYIFYLYVILIVYTSRNLSILDREMCPSEVQKD